MFREYSPRKIHADKCDANDKDFRLCDWRIALSALVFSLCVITAKLYSANREFLHDAFVQVDLTTVESIAEDGRVTFRHVWKESLRHSSLWLPVLCGFLATYFTWTIVYLDSMVPGVQPPSPLSPSKYKQQSGHTFHLNYIFSVVIGVLITSYMYFNGVQIQY